uniref:Putative LRR receptor-like serine/threonine-protein kinase n=1 Tax=Aegilops tauschii TaxID=37682 RepID=R7W5U1_AEGTA
MASMVRPDVKVASRHVQTSSCPPKLQVGFKGYEIARTFEPDVRNGATEVCNKIELIAVNTGNSSLTLFFQSGLVHCSSERLHRAFRQELDVLLSLRHPHIVRLLGYCDERDEGVLVFEYAPNGDLHQRLHGGEDAAAPLPWSRRVAIAFQVATALEYLHEGSGPAVVHGDIKASNVLLDGNMDAKLCDFGFAHSGVSATAGRGRSSGRAIMGSPGYVDPQLLRTGVANEQSDVYSFGVLLLELVTGREAVCRETGRRLTAVVCPTISKGNVADAVDRSLAGKYSADEAAVVAELAMRCVSDAPGLRPSMADVVHVLQEKTTALISAVGPRLDRRIMF